MLLKYLDIQGFKSFPDKTRVAFGKGLTAVVGPNGSGKSNISDAVRWVMGEQSTKTLRGSKMEDVIFAGTKTRKSQGFAEVSLTIDNTSKELAIDSDEVTITRRYDRSGDSEYMINRSLVRLKDLQEFLMDTGLGKDGYSLVGQGKIAEVVESKSNERREIFEEAAGISKFRYKKNESERNLLKAEENLVRLRDILSELEGRVEPLREQSEKAKKFLELSQTKKSLEVSLWIDTLNRSNRILKDQGDKILASTVSRDEIESRIKSIEAAIQKAFSDMQECLVSNEQLRKNKEIIESEIAQIIAQTAVCQNNIEHNNQGINRVENEIENYKKSGESAQNDLAERENDVTILSQKAVELNKEIARKQEQLLNMSSDGEDFSKSEKELNSEINQLLLNESQEKMTIATAQINLNELTVSMQNFETDDITDRHNLSSYDKELDEADSLVLSLDSKEQELKNTYSGYKLKLDNRQKKLQELKVECDKADLSVKEKDQKMKLLEGMEQSLEGFAFSVREVLKLSKSGALQGLVGTVSQIIEVSDEYSTAIETALGGAMQNIVTQSESDAKTAIRALKQGNLGRATFLPMTTISGGELNINGLDRYQGFIGSAKSLVEYDDKYDGIVSSLLGRIAIVDDIDTAVLIAKGSGYKFKVVTLDGQVVNAGGSLTGGSKNKGQSFLSRKNEITALKSEVETLSQKHKNAVFAMQTLSAEVAKIEAQVSALLSEMTTLNEDRIRVEGECKRINQLKLQLTQTIAKRASEQVIRTTRQREFTDAKCRAEEKQIKLQKGIAEKTELLSSLQETVHEMVDSKTNLMNELSELNINKVTLSKDIEAVLTAIEQLKKRKQETGDTSERLYAEINDFNLKNEAELNAIEKFNEEITLKRTDILTIEKQLEETLLKRQQFEGEATKLRREEREVSEQKEKFTSEIARLEEKKSQLQLEYDSIIAKLWDEYELTRSEAQDIAVEIENPQKTTSDLNGLKSKIRGLGTVNLEAIEEYQEVAQRYEFLKRQIDDVEQSRNELQRLINELLEKMKSIFSENFDKINYHFKKIFAELFGGGSAELKLTDPENVLESGIDIIAEPPGKLFRNLTSLSGGEQALIAIAIYFAIFKVHPAPFCILDEIEAALDEVNVDKYAQYLRSISNNTQFIMITHRRGSMEAADVLYGVTMQDEGVSKLLELNVSQIEQKLNMQL